ncbi:MAG: indole-3-glycerol phosphate synthase TrpC [Vulcanimicrobiaceae bacterium]
MPDILTRIFARKAQLREAAESVERFEQLHARALERIDERRPFADALRSSSHLSIIAEIKRASPSAGLITRDFDPAQIARGYEAAGADAISVITEADHFLGDLAFLDLVRSACTKPLLRKDFLATPYEIAQAAAYGADAILLIVAGLDDVSLHACREQARLYRLDVLVEIHDENELERAVRLDAEMIGVNNRDLRTFRTDLATSEHLMPAIPRRVVAVSESGVRDVDDAQRLGQAGAQALLVGESLMRSDDPAALVKAFRFALRQ